jgi:uncharacterized protein
MPRRDAKYWIEKLGMQAHPEGGYYRETFRSADEIQTAGLPARFGGPRACSTAIYFLLESGQFSALHRIQSEEVWHHYTGSGVTIHVIGRDGRLRTHALGPDPETGEAFQVAISAGEWFGATVDDAASFALVGCTVAPGFCFEDFQLGERAALVEQYPELRETIERLTR